MSANCLFCSNEVENIHDQLANGKIDYECRRCGIVSLTEEAYDDFPSEQFSDEEKKILSIVLRNEYEMSN
jgi:DNA-directed RNA polymerase subunit RPC12/RpoP